MAPKLWKIPHSWLWSWRRCPSCVPAFWDVPIHERGESRFFRGRSRLSPSSISPGLPHPGMLEEVSDLLVVTGNSFTAEKSGNWGWLPKIRSSTGPFVEVVSAVICPKFVIFRLFSPLGSHGCPNSSPSPSGFGCNLAELYKRTTNPGFRNPKFRKKLVGALEKPEEEARNRHAGTQVHKREHSRFLEVDPRFLRKRG